MISDFRLVGVAHQAVAAIAAEQRVVLGIPDERVIAIAAAQVIVAIVGGRFAQAICADSAVVAAQIVVAGATDDGIGTAVAAYVVVAFAAVDVVIAGWNRRAVADQQAVRVAGNCVIAAPAEDDIVTFVARNGVVAVVAPDGIVAALGRDQVVARSGMDFVGVADGHRGIVDYDRGVDRVERCARPLEGLHRYRGDVARLEIVVAIDDVVAAATDEKVLAATAEDDVVAVGTHDRVVAEAALQPFARRDRERGGHGAGGE